MQHSRILQRVASLGVQQFRFSSQIAAEPIADWTQARLYNEIPGPKPLPLIGNAWRFMPVIGTIPVEDFIVWMKHMHKTYGPISKISNIPGRRDLVFLFDPRDFETVYRHEGIWPERLLFDSLPYYRRETRKDFFQGVGGILAENGEGWQDFRTFVNPVMMQPRNSRLYATRIDDTTNDFMKLIPGMLDEKSELPGDFDKEVQKWALESISLVALDTRIGCLAPNLAPDSEPYRLIHAADEIFELLFKLDAGFPLWKFVTTPGWKRYVAALDLFTEVCMRHITNAQQRMKENPNKDEAETSVLEKLLKRDPNPKKAVVMALDMMLAGIDTTSYTSAFVLYNLARNPEKQEKLYAELVKAMPTPDTPLTADIHDNLKYLKACIKENNRINPIAVGNGRLTQEDIVVSNYHIPKGVDMLMCNSIITNLDEHYPEASRFIPERWLKSEECPFQDKKAHPFSYMPFGFGKRNCVGMRFATLEIETLVAKVVRNYRLEWHYDDMRFKSQAVLMPADPLKIRLLPRNK